MTDNDFKDRESDRATRLVQFVKNEILNMHVDARLQFTVNLFNYLKPEIEHLLKDERIERP